MATLECRELPNHNSHILVDQCSDRCLVTLVSVKGLMAEIGGSSVMRDTWFSSCWLASVRDPWIYHALNLNTSCHAVVHCTLF